MEAADQASQRASQRASQPGPEPARPPRSVYCQNIINRVSPDPKLLGSPLLLPPPSQAAYPHCRSSSSVDLTVVDDRVGEALRIGPPTMMRITPAPYDDEMKMKMKMGCYVEVCHAAGARRQVPGERWCHATGFRRHVPLDRCQFNSSRSFQFSSIQFSSV